jgi:hypothetical protein
MKRKNEEKARNMENSVRKETIKKNEKRVEFSLAAQRQKRYFLPVNLIIGIFDRCR